MKLDARKEINRMLTKLRQRPAAKKTAKESLSEEAQSKQDVTIKIRSVLRQRPGQQ